MSLVIPWTKIQMTYICMDKNSNDIYLQGRKTYLSHSHRPIITCHMGTTSLMTVHLSKKPN